MKAWPSTRLSILGAAIILVFSLALIPGDSATAEPEKPPYVPLKIINESQFTFTIWLYGPEFYELSVPPHSEDDWLVDRGWYNFTMNSCNYSKAGTLDLTLRKTIHVPVCGGSALVDNHYKPYDVDAGDYIKPIKVRIINKTKEEIGIYIRTLDYDHFLNFAPLETQEVIMIKDRYVYSYVACGKLHVGYWTANIGLPLEIKCQE